MSDVVIPPAKDAILKSSSLAEEYRGQLEAHIVESSEAVLHRAYELGRQAIGDGVSLLDMTILHHNALSRILGRQPLEARNAVMVKASIFLTESLSPFEMLLRRYRDSNASLLAERKAIEQQLRQIQKMEAIGQLTGGIAHDFNNLLGIIVGNVELLLDSAQEGQRDVVGAVLSATMRGAELTRRLLAFARQQPLNPRVVNLNERLPETIKLLRRTLGETVRIKMTLTDGLWLTNVDPSQVEDAIINLAINARDSMPKGGDLKIETANACLDKQYAARHLEVVAGDYVMLAVSDTGVGMPPEVIERATEPFFTTKQLGEGTGLGLSMIYGFVRQSNGHLTIESEVGVGTTVRLYLPKAAGEASCVVRDPGAARDAPRANEFILLVDDNTELRQLATWQLTDLGYRVRSAATGEAALKLLGTDGPFDLLFTDIGLPGGMDGLELAKRARQRQPRLKVLFTTGHGKRPQQDGDDCHEAGDILLKPYRKAALAAKIRAALEAPA